MADPFPTGSFPSGPVPPGVPRGRPLVLPGRGTTYLREVAGPPGAPALVLLHGWTATAALNWATSFAALGRRFRVLAVDQRGHGRGIRPLGPFRLEDCADDVVALADALGIPRVVPVGYSLGGPVAQLAARRHPDRVAGLVLCATSGDFGGGEEAATTAAASPEWAQVAAALRLVPPLVRQGWMRAALRPRPQDPPERRWARAEMGRSDPAALAEAGRALRRFSSRDWLGALGVPAAVVVTTEDRLVPSARQLALARAIPGATVHPVEAGHDACWSRPDRFVPALVAACEAVAPRRGSGARTGAA